jgi:tRNA (guanine26-N2/guanine27-N2)-dimethyltransferase
MSTDASKITVPEGYTLHSEGSAHILLPTTHDAFLNPVQEFNRDLSVACIRTWTEETNEVKKQRWDKSRAHASNGKENGAARDAKRTKGMCAPLYASDNMRADIFPT